MRNPNELKEYVLFQVNESEALKEYLEEMALKGWKLKYYSNYFGFEKIEPQRLYYSVEVFSKASVYDTILSDSTNKHIDYCRMAGWDFVCKASQVNIFVSTLDNSFPVIIDGDMKLKSIIKGALKQNITTWFIWFPMLLLYIVFSFSDFEFLITTNLGLINLLTYMMLIMSVIFQIAGFIIWTVKQKRRIKNGEPLNHPVLKYRGWRND